MTQNVETISAMLENATSLLSDALFCLNARLDANGSTPSTSIPMFDSKPKKEKRVHRVQLKLKQQAEGRVEESTPPSAE